ncbi:MAG: hypothetical protein OXF79_24590 [Chloroflexi bacterium]|nr:hypothetical protein [Chloroflexota bacterium]
MLDQPDPVNDVEVAEVVNGEFDLTPLSAEGVRAISDYLGCKAELGVPVRVTEDQYGKLNKHIYLASDRYGGFSIGMRQRFRGQRLADQADLDLLAEPDLSSELSEKLSFGRSVHLRDYNFTVAVARYGPPAAGRLFKVTKREHAPAESLAVSVGTLSYYRKTTDEHEASFTASGPGPTMRTLDGEVIGRPDDVVSFSMGVDPCWIYCTTSVDDGGLRADQVAKWGGGRMATSIESPVNHFARILGATFGIWSQPRIREVYQSLEGVDVLKYTMNGIMVVHGPVRYMNAVRRNRHLEALSRQGSPIEIWENVFTKNGDFAWEGEYRFGIWGWGPPLQGRVLMDVTADLLDCFGPAVEVSSLVAARHP